MKKTLKIFGMLLIAGALLVGCKPNADEPEKKDTTSTDTAAASSDAGSSSSSSSQIDLADGNWKMEMLVEGTFTTGSEAPAEATIAYDPDTIIAPKNITTANYTKNGSALTINNFESVVEIKTTFPDTTESSTIEIFNNVFQGIVDFTIYQLEYDENGLPVVDENYNFVFALDGNGEKIPVPGISGSVTTEDKTVTMSITHTGEAFADELPTTTDELNTAFPEGATVTSNSDKSVYTITYSDTVESNGYTIPCTATVTLTKQ